MKRIGRATFMLGLGFALSQTLLAQQFKITFDENGHGTVNGQPLPFTVAPDPTGGVTTSPVLIYVLPYDIQGGDVRLTELGQPNAPVSDIIRFFSPLPGGKTSDLIFYSDVESGEAPNLADVGLPVSSTTVSINETGPEGNNGAVWSPTLPEPGTPLLGGPVTGTVQYAIVSDGSLPEHGSAALLPMVLVILASLRRFCSKDRPASLTFGPLP
jgi:hypothetical protein